MFLLTTEYETTGGDPEEDQVTSKGRDNYPAGSRYPLYSPPAESIVGIHIQALSVLSNRLSTESRSDFPSTCDARHVLCSDSVSICCSLNDSQPLPCFGKCFARLGEFCAITLINQIQVAQLRGCILLLLLSPHCFGHDISSASIVPVYTICIISLQFLAMARSVVSESCVAASRSICTRVRF